MLIIKSYIENTYIHNISKFFLGKYINTIFVFNNISKDQKNGIEFLYSL